jgi:hypothetical protein
MFWPCGPLSFETYTWEELPNARKCGIGTLPSRVLETRRLLSVLRRACRPKNPDAPPKPKTLS